MALAVIKRETWGAAPPKTAWRDHTPDRITIHHTAGGTTDKFKGHETIRAIQKFHQDAPVKDDSGKRIGGGRGFKDIGYHYIIAPDGSVYEGRPETVIGAHVTNDNTGNVGISLYGNFDTEKPTWEQIDTLPQLIAEISARWVIPTTRVFIHKQRDTSTDCPGANLAPVLSQIKASVDDLKRFEVEKPAETVVPPGDQQTIIEPKVPVPAKQPVLPASAIVIILALILIALLRD